MLVSKPEGLCTVSHDLEKRQLVLGFHTSQDTQAFRDQVVNRVVEAAQGGRKPAIEYNMPIHFSETKRESATAQTIVDCIESMRKQARTMRDRGMAEIAVIFETRAKQIEDDINNYLADR